MHRLNELVEKLTPAQIQEVEDFAAFLISRRAVNPDPVLASSRPNQIDLDKLVGMCKGMGGDKTNEELLREAWNGVAEKLMKE